MHIIGYSERGIVNALFYEIAHSSSPDILLGQLLERTTFPHTPERPAIDEPEVLIEQGFSDFGDADAVILGVAPNRSRTCIFCEAKVKSYGRIEKEFDRFESFLQDKKRPYRDKRSSNLFTQIYHKMRMVQELSKEDGLKALEKGIGFPEWSTKGIRKIGKNNVVQKAAQKIKDSMDKVFYLMIIPDCDPRVAALFATLPQQRLDNIPGWDVSHIGYITWPRIKGWCQDVKLQNTISVFDYNKGQII